MKVSVTKQKYRAMHENILRAILDSSITHVIWMWNFGLFWYKIKTAIQLITAGNAKKTKKLIVFPRISVAVENHDEVVLTVHNFNGIQFRPRWLHLCASCWMVVCGFAQLIFHQRSDKMISSFRATVWQENRQTNWFVHAWPIYPFNCRFHWCFWPVIWSIASILLSTVPANCQSRAVSWAAVWQLR